MKAKVLHVWDYIETVLKWLVVATLIGIAGGGIGTLFHHGVEHATHLREAHGFLLYCLPLAGVGIAAFYRLTRTEGVGTNIVIDAVHHARPSPPCWCPPFLWAPCSPTCAAAAPAGRGLRCRSAAGWDM